MVRSSALVLASVLTLALSTACTVENKTPAAQSKPAGAADGGKPSSSTAQAKPKTQPKVASLKSKASSKPPAGATSKGVQSKPAAGAITVPVENVEVYTFALDFDGDGTDDTINWAAVETGSTYLWVVAPITCEDGSTDAAGAFVMEVKADGSGSYLFSSSGCASSDLFGCDFDASGTETTCGACSIVENDIACVVAE